MFPTGSFSISKNCLASRDSCCSARKVSFCFMMSKCHSIEGKKKQKKLHTIWGEKEHFSILDYICQHLGSESALLCQNSVSVLKTGLTSALLLPSVSRLGPWESAEGRLSIIYHFPSSVNYYQHHKNVESSNPNIYVVYHKYRYFEHSTFSD